MLSRDLRTQTKKITVFLRTSLDKDNNCQNWNEKNKPGKMVKLVGLTVVPKIKSCKTIITEKDN